jgi:glycosyltransferase involved in cell wall biosynthesis
MPFYPGLELSVPSVPALVDVLSEGRYDLVHVVSPGPNGAGASLLARLLELPVVGSYHTELAAYAGLRSRQKQLELFAARLLQRFYGACEIVLSPSPASDERIRSLGIAAERIRRWDRGVDLKCFGPARREANLLPGGVNVLYAGRVATEKGIELLADSFLAARGRDERLHLAVAGGGPEEPALRERLGEHATFLGWLDRDEIARAYASADVFMFASKTDTFGQVVLEAQASGLPVIAVDAGGPASLIEHGRTGLLVPPDADALASALLTLARRPSLRRHLSRGALAAVRARTWEVALERLAGSYRSVLERGRSGQARRAA